MLVHIIADYGHGDLAFAKSVQVSVQLVKTRIMPPLEMPSRGQEGETGPLHPAGRLHERR